MRIELPCRRELDFQGFGGSKKRRILTHFWKGSKGRSGEAFLTDIADLGSPVGFQRGSISEGKAIFLRSEIWTIFGGPG